MELIQNIGYYTVGSLPLVGYLGIITYLFLLATAATMILTKRHIVIIHVKYHKSLAYITIILATLHFIFAISIYL
ncbi:MAG: hypothetical protein ACOC4G_10580 [Bacillota bacterium]